MRHLKLAARMLLKTPFVTAIAVASLALGIGANAAIFSLFNEILLQPLPVLNPNQLVNLANPGPKPGSQSCGQAGGCDEVFSYPMFKDLDQQQTAFTGIAAHFGFGANLAVKNEPSTGQGIFVSGSYFPVLGLKPAVGRLLGPSDDAVIGANFVTVLGYEFWLERFGGDRNAVGQSIVVNGKTFTIVGVAPRGFRSTTLGMRPTVFVPISMREVVESRRPAFENHRSYWIYLFARLKPGVSIEQAQRGQSDVHREAKTPLFMLFSITGIVLLIACANIANLLLARGAGRAMEMGVRLALGSSRRQLLTQLLTESVLLAFVGGLASLLVAQWTLRAIGALLPPEAAATFSLSIKWPVVFFAAGLSIATGIVFGMFPALHSTRADLITTIRAGAGQITGGKSATRFLTALVTVGVLAYAVAQRMREIGVRMALGADGAHVRALVMRQLGLMVIVGGVVGVAAAFGLGRAAQSLLYGLQGHDPIVFTLSVAMLTGVAGLASYIPARRAAHVEPMHALRYD